MRPWFNSNPGRPASRRAAPDADEILLREIDDDLESGAGLHRGHEREVPRTDLRSSSEMRLPMFAKWRVSSPSSNQSPLHESQWSSSISPAIHTDIDFEHFGQPR